MDIQCVVFDFDGTLVDSNFIKKEAFFYIVSDLRDGRKILEEILCGPKVGDRHDILSRFVAQCGLPSSTTSDLATLYTDLTEKLVSECPFMPGAEETLRILNDRGYRLYINSATPDASLERILRQREMAGWLSGWFGSALSKADNLQKIAARESLAAKDLVFVGDGADDQEAALAVGCLFVPVFEGRGARHSQPLTDLTALLEIIRCRGAAFTNDAPRFNLEE